MASRLQIRPEEFLTLLITELRYQDPLAPVDEREMLSQLAQLQELSEMQAMRRAMESGEAAAIRAVGRRVWWVGPDGQVREGRVDRAVRQQDGWWLEVEEELVPWWAVQAVGR